MPDRFARFLSLAAGIFVLLAIPASAVEVEDPTTLEDLFVLFDVGDVAADFVIVVDTSGSMSQGDNPPYPGVLVAYNSLIDTIPDGDFVSVVTFDSDPNLVFRGPLTHQTREIAKESLPEVARGSHTDIGAALDATLRRLERADSSDVQTVIFLTDGIHNPPEGSAYPENSGQAWEELRDRAIIVAETHDLLFLGIGLLEGTDIGLLRTVFANPELNSLSPEQLPAFFEEAIKRSQLSRLRILVNSELGAGVRIRSTTQAELSSSIEASIDITSGFEKLPVRVTISKVAATDRAGNVIPARLLGDEVLRLAPGETVSVAVNLRPDIDPERFVVPPETETAEYTVTLDAVYTVEPNTVLRRVTPATTTGTVTGTAFVDATRTFGWTVARAVIVLLIGLLALLILLWLYRRFLRLPPLVGVFVLDEPNPDGEEVTIKLKRKKMTLDSSNMPGTDQAKLRLFTKRGHPGRVWASVEQPPFYEVVSPLREEPVSDVTEIRFGDYRLGFSRMMYRPRASTRKTKDLTREDVES